MNIKCLKCGRRTNTRKEHKKYLCRECKPNRKEYRSHPKDENSKVSIFERTIKAIHKKVEKKFKSIKEYNMQVGVIKRQTKQKINETFK